MCSSVWRGLPQGYYQPKICFKIDGRFHDYRYAVRNGKPAHPIHLEINGLN